MCALGAISRATRAPRDAAWVADGLVSDEWMPVSPISGRLDAFVWTVPPATLGSRANGMDDVLADLDDPSAPLIEARADNSRVEPEPATIIAPKPDAKPVIKPEPEPAKAPAPTPGPVAAEPVAVVTPQPKPEPKPAPPAIIEHEPGQEPKHEPKIEQKHAPKPEAAVAKPAVNGTGHAKPVIFPVSHAPDDPGPEEAQPPEADKKAKFRIFG